MDNYAYDAGLVCQNSACKSHGQSHPNCKCYSEHAEGGEASFCSQERPHESGCQYFTEGGDTQYDFSGLDASGPAPTPAETPSPSPDTTPKYDFSGLDAT